MLSKKMRQAEGLAIEIGDYVNGFDPDQADYDADTLLLMVKDFKALVEELADEQEAQGRVG